jgi:hypothetical protein
LFGPFNLQKEDPTRNAFVSPDVLQNLVEANMTFLVLRTEVSFGMAAQTARYSGENLNSGLFWRSIVATPM